MTEVPVTGGHVQAAVEARLGDALGGAGRRLRDVRQGPDRLGQRRRTASARSWAASRRRGSSTNSSSTSKDQKISKSKGNGLTMEDWLRYGSPESLALLHVPEAAARPSGSISTSSPRRWTNICSSSTPINRAEARGRPAAGQSGLAYPCGRAAGETARRSSSALLLNLVSAANASTRRSCGASCRATSPARRRRASPCSTGWSGYALQLLRGLRAAGEGFRAPDEQERAAMEDLAARLEGPAGRLRATARRMQNEVYEVGKAAGFEPLRAWFAALYEVLLGQTPGPALRLLRRHLRPGPDHRPDRAGAGGGAYLRRRTNHPAVGRTWSAKRARRTFLSILPVAPSGMSSTKTTSSGVHHLAILPSPGSRGISRVAISPGLSLTSSRGRSSHLGWAAADHRGRAPPWDGPRRRSRSRSS